MKNQYAAEKLLEGGLCLHCRKRKFIEPEMVWHAKCATLFGGNVSIKEWKILTKE